MARTFAPIDLVSLPRLDANAALALARALESAAGLDKKSILKLPESVEAALHDLRGDREALQEAMGGAPVTAADVQKADREEDAAISALYWLCVAWARVAGRIPEGDVAQTLLDRLFENGLSFVNLKVTEEWTIIETKLQIIERELLDVEFEKLGAMPLLRHLRRVHKRYGEVVGTTKPPVSSDSPHIRDRLEALLASIRHYVIAVTGSIQRRKPKTQELADALLLPLAQWSPEEQPDA